MFITEQMMAQARRNIREHSWAADVAQKVVERAAPWLKKSDDELWHLMFGPGLRRAWKVYADGFCPSCQASVTMFTWRIDGLNQPWKVACPHCQSAFPKNDFAAYYRSGLDEHSVFNVALADRSLLFNSEHPDPKDPLHLFGVDDGEGYRDGDHCWYFMGAYLIYGLWKQQIVTGIEALAEAYVASGELVYARKAAILLDRVADLYTGFDFKTQAAPHDKGQPAGNGYVSTWHDASRETHIMVNAYDMIRGALSKDPALVEFLSRKARQYKLANPKAHWTDIKRNIDDGLLRDALKNEHRIASNYPRAEIVKLVILEVLGEPGIEKTLQTQLDAIIERTSLIDGITGEKGLAAYSGYTIATLAEYLAVLSRRDPAFLPACVARNPRLRLIYRFHIDTWCLQKYYPNIGDGTAFAEPVTNWDPEGRPSYAGMFVSKKPGIGASMFTFLMDLAKATGDLAYVQVLYQANDRTTQNLPYDVCLEDPTAFQREVERIIAAEGPLIKLPSINKQLWCLGILRSGQGDAARALWIDYDIGGGHAHSDGLNLGLFAKGLDLMPDRGYPQIQYHSTEPLKSAWFLRTAAHNTVVVDGRDQNNLWRPPALGKTTLWADGTHVHAIRARFDADPYPTPELYGQHRGYVALYAYYVGRFSAVRVWTRQSLSDEWTLQFSDDFRRSELGPDWQVIDGEWRIENGQLIGKGTLLCTRNMPGMQRLEYEGQSNDDAPCDLSAFLACNRSGGSEFFFGFGSNRNQESKLIVYSLVEARSDVRIVPGKRHQISCVYEKGLLQMTVDGQVSLRCDGLKNATLNMIFGEAEGPRQFERTAALIDISPEDAYIVDVFRVVGGKDHARFFHSYFGTVTTEGVKLSPDQDYGHDTLLRDFRTDAAPQPGWQVDWSLEDRFRLLPAGANVHLRHTDFTREASGSLAESWANVGNFNKKDEVWLPAIMTRHRGPAPLATTFVEVIEPYEGRSNIKSIKRLALLSPAGSAYADNFVALEIELIDGRRDLVLSADPANPLNYAPSLAKDKVMVQPDWGVRTDGEFCVVRRDVSGRVIYTALGRGRMLEAGELSIQNATVIDFVERVGK